jgi:hypothetical protein
MAGKNGRVKSTCTGCGLVFVTTAAFDKHRTGSYGKPIEHNGQVIGYTPEMRVCITEEAMAKRGMIKNSKGLWSTGSFNGAAFWATSKKVDDEPEDVSEIA